MIDIQQIFIRVNNDLSKKGKGGYTNNDEFNRDIIQGQQILMNSLIKALEVGRDVMERLKSHTIETPLTLSAYKSDLPDNYRYALEARVVEIYNIPGCNEPKIVSTPMDYTRLDEEHHTNKSCIRGDDYNYTVVGDLFRSNLESGKVILKHLINPVGYRSVTLNIITAEEDYDNLGSTHLLWDDNVYNELVNILLVLKGVETKDQQLIQLVSAL